MHIPGSYEDLIQRARQARAAGQPEAAIESYRRVVDRLSRVLPEMSPRDEQLQGYLITAADELQLVLDWMGEHAQANALCRQMAELDPDDSQLWRRRAATELIYTGEVESGLAELRQLTKEAPDDFWHPLELAAQLLEMDRLEEAESMLAEAAQRARESEELGLLHWTRFRLLRKQGQFHAAARAWETARKHDAFFKRASETVYRMFIEAGDYDSALLYLDAEENPLVAGYYRGLLAHYRGDHARAEKAWRRVVQNRPGDFDAGWEAWAMAQFRLGERNTALEFLLTLIQRGYTAEPCYLAIALIWAASGEAEVAKANLDTALRIRRQTFGPRALLPADLWSDFEELVTDEGLKQELRSYFAPAESAASSAEAVTPGP